MTPDHDAAQAAVRCAMVDYYDESAPSHIGGLWRTSRTGLIIAALTLLTYCAVQWVLTADAERVEIGDVQ